MKDFNKLTNEEINKLTSEDLEKYVRIGLMNEGIKIPREPENLALEEVEKPDIKMYSVTNVSGFFLNREDAEAVAEKLNAAIENMCRNDYGEYKTVKPYFHSYEDKTFSVKEEQGYSPELYKKISHKLESNRRIKETYEKDRKRYEQEVEAAQTVKDEIYEKYDKVTSKFRELEKYRDLFKEYLDLADKDKVKAMKFFKKAYTIGADEEHYILNGKLPVHSEAAEDKDASK